MPGVFTVLIGGAALRGIPPYADGDFVQPTQLEADITMDEDRPRSIIEGSAIVSSLEVSTPLPSLFAGSVGIPSLTASVKLPELTTTVSLTPGNYY